MVATVAINEWNEGGGSPAAKTAKDGGTVRFKNADDPTVDLINPLIVPTSGREFSFQKMLQLEITAAGGFTQIDNLQAYSDGENDFGGGSPTLVDLFYAVTGTLITPVVPSEAVAVPQFDGSDMQDIFQHGSGSRIDMDASNPGPYTSTGEIGDIMVMVMRVMPGAGPGVLTAETLTFSYDEI